LYVRRRAIAILPVLLGGLGDVHDDVTVLIQMHTMGRGARPCRNAGEACHV
jgi:hypothetical protein